MAKFAPLYRTLLTLGCLVLVSPAWAVEPTENLLPATTKGFVSTPSLNEAEAKFDETQLGKMLADPLMQPFVEDLRRQLRSRMDKAGKRVGVTWDDLKKMDAGEVALAAIQPDPKNKQSHASVLIVDVTGKEPEARQLMAKIAANQIAQRGVKSAAKAGAIEVTVFTLPVKADEPAADQVAYFLHQDQLVLSDSPAAATGIAGRFGKDAADSLARLPAFQHVMARNAKAAEGAKANIRWFIEPFGYTEVSRAMNGGKRKRGRDLLKILANQGFDAVKGLGGNVFLATEHEEILHRTFIYAPAVVRKEGDKSKDKYNLAMRMLNFPNSDDLSPPAWVPQDVASYLSFRCKLKDAFWHSESLVDEYAGDVGVFKAMWDNMKLDPSGPMIDIEKELVDHLGERVTLISDVTIPVDLKSERLIVAIELIGPKGPEVVKKTLQKAFEADPSAKKREFQGHIIWELLNDQSAEDPMLSVETGVEMPVKVGGGGDDGDAGEEAVEEEKPILPNMAFSVVNGQLFVATHVEFIEEIIGKQKASTPLMQLSEYQRVDNALARLGASQDSFRFYSRTDESYRGTYELLRQGKLPQAETVFARLLNGLLGSGEKGEIRRQELDGSKLPEFKHVQKYLGPAGSYIHSEDDGWFLVGCLLKKEAR